MNVLCIERREQGLFSVYLFFFIYTKAYYRGNLDLSIGEITEIYIQGWILSGFTYM